MKKLNTLKGAIVAGTLGLLLSIGTVQAEPQFHERGGMKMMKMMAKKLGLSDAQRDQMKQIMQDAKADKDQYQAEFKNYNDQLAAIIQANEFDEAAFNALNKTYQPMFEAKALAKAKVRHQMYQLLNDEQKQKMASLKEERQSRHPRSF